MLNHQQQETIQLTIIILFIIMFLMFYVLFYSTFLLSVADVNIIGVQYCPVMYHHTYTHTHICRHICTHTHTHTNTSPNICIYYLETLQLEDNFILFYLLISYSQWYTVHNHTYDDRNNKRCI